MWAYVGIRFGWNYSSCGLKVELTDAPTDESVLFKSQ